MPLRIAYVMSRFPHLPETFILREMSEMKTLGWDIAVYPLIVQTQQPIHAEAKSWLQQVRYTSFFSAAMWKSNLLAFLKQPLRYAGLTFRMIRENRRSMNFLLRALVILPRAIHASRQMQHEQISHIHAHYATHPALFAWIVHQWSGMTYSVTVHAHDIFVRKTMLATKLRCASAVICISQYNRDYLVRELGQWVLNKAEIVHCGIDPDKYARSKDIHARTDHSEHVFQIISVGSLQPYKGFRHLIDACSLLRAAGVRFQCRIIGGGELEAELQMHIMHSHLKDCVILLGSQTEDAVARLLLTADCYVQPSVIMPSGKMEGIPVALMEAMACELPVVASDLSGVSELVRDDVTGLLVPPGDAALLAQAIRTVTDQPDEARTRAQRGRALVLEQFNLKTNVATLSEILQRIIHDDATTLPNNCTYSAT